MFKENALLPFELSTSMETETRSVRIRCRNDHVFADDIPSVINTEQSPALLEEITQEGCVTCRCPHCGELVKLAEPIVIHDGKSSRAAVFLPEVLVHRELEVRAFWAFAVARCDVEKLPFYYEDSPVLVGRRELENWQNGVGLPGPGRPRYLRKTKDRQAADGSAGHEADPSIESARSIGRESAPGIHAAFADLALQETSVKHETDVANGHEPEAQFDDEEDWLNDAMIEASSQMTSVSHSAEDTGVEREVATGPLEPEEDLPTLSSLDDPEEGPGIGAIAQDKEEDVEEIDEDDISIITAGPEPRKDSRPTSPLPGGIDASASRSTCAVESGKVVLGRCVPLDIVRRFSEKHGDLRIELHMADEVPVATLSLVIADSEGGEPAKVVWYIDPIQNSHREALEVLQEDFSAEIRLFTEDLEEAAQFEVTALREKNAARIWERLLAQWDPGWSAEQIEVAQKKVAQDTGSGASEEPFEESRLVRPGGLSECVEVVAFLEKWLAAEAYEDLVFSRSYPLAKLEAAVADALEVALELGVRIPPVLKDSALKHGAVRDFKQMIKDQSERLRASAAREQVEAADLAALWAGQLADARVSKVALEDDLAEHGREQIRRAGKDPDEEVDKAVQGLIAAGEQLPSSLLVDLLGSREHEHEALRLLVERCEPQTYPDIVNAFADFGPEQVVAAVEAFPKIAEGIASDLAGLLASPSPFVRQAAAVVIGRTCPKNVVEELMIALEGETTPIWKDIARAAARAGDGITALVEREEARGVIPAERLAYVLGYGWERGFVKAECARPWNGDPDREDTPIGAFGRILEDAVDGRVAPVAAIQSAARRVLDDLRDIEQNS